VIEHNLWELDLLNIPKNQVIYIGNTGLILTKPISRRLYKSMGKTTSKFVEDYVNSLQWNTSEPLNGKKPINSG
jgi:hypothetical protein